MPARYLGLSVEWSMVQRWFRRTDAGAPVVRLLRGLRATNGQGGVLRIGGDSQDGYLWSAQGPLSANRLFQGVINAHMVHAVLAVARASGWKVTLGVDLRDGLAEQAVQLTRAAVQDDRGHVLVGIELGNEPNASNPDVRVYLARVRAYAAALAADPNTRQVRLVGPSVSSGADLGWIRRLRSEQGPRLAFSTWHDYANQPSLRRLLAPQVSESFAARVRLALQASRPLATRMDEGNSVGKGGLPRVSDVTGSAAWLVDSLLTGARLGLAGYNVHSWDGHDYPSEHRQAFYTPFVIRNGAVEGRPGFSALALLASLPGSTMCRTAVSSSARKPVRAWTYATTRRRLSVVLDSEAVDGRVRYVRLVLPAGWSAGARLVRLHDPSGCSGREPRLGGAVLRPDGSFTPAATLLTDPSHLRVRLAPCDIARVDLQRSA